MARYDNEIRVKIEAQIIEEQKGLSATGVPTHSAGGIGISKAVAANFVSKGAQYAISNYGNWTGDYQTQSSINSTLELASLVGIALTGTAGAVAAGTTFAVRGVDYFVHTKKRSQEIEYLRARTGMFDGRSR